MFKAKRIRDPDALQAHNRILQNELIFLRRDNLQLKHELKVVTSKYESCKKLANEKEDTLLKKVNVLQEELKSTSSTGHVVVKEGYLKVKYGKKQINSSRRVCVLTSNAVYYKKGNRLKLFTALETACLVMHPKQNREFLFGLLRSDGVLLTFAAESLCDRGEWVQALEVRVCASALTCQEVPASFMEAQADPADAEPDEEEGDAKNDPDEAAANATHDEQVQQDPATLSPVLASPLLGVADEPEFVDADPCTSPLTILKMNSCSRLKGHKGNAFGRAAASLRSRALSLKKISRIDGDGSSTASTRAFTDGPDEVGLSPLTTPPPEAASVSDAEESSLFFDADDTLFGLSPLSVETLPQDCDPRMGDLRPPSLDWSALLECEKLDHSSLRKGLSTTERLKLDSMMNAMEALFSDGVGRLMSLKFGGTQQCCYRWLRRADWKLDDALRSCRETLVWREQHGLDAYLDEKSHLYENFRADWPVAFHKYSSDGHPVHLWRAGFLRPAVLLEHPETDRTSYWLYLLEAALSLERFSEADRGEAVIGTDVVVDLAGFTKSHLHMTGLAYFAELLSLMVQHYPCIERRVVLLNVPTMFSLAWRAISGTLPESFRRKVEMIPDSGTSVLLAFLSKKDIPSFLGGGCTCRGGGCIPREAVECLHSKGTSISRGGLVDVPVRIETPGAEVCWRLHTTAFDIAFGIGRELAIGKVDMLLPLKRYECAYERRGDGVSGKFIAHEAGDYVFLLDNSHSTMRSKRVCCSITVDGELVHCTEDALPRC
eukprot:Rmarinus@m.9559